MKKTIHCKRCGDLCEHNDISAELNIGNVPVKVVFACVHCGQNQVQEVTKSDYLGLPPETAVRFKCDHCNTVCGHFVSRVVRGHKQALVVLHCKECNAEVRKFFLVGEIPQEILGEGRPTPHKSATDSSVAS